MHTHALRYAQSNFALFFCLFSTFPALIQFPNFQIEQCSANSAAEEQFIQLLMQPYTSTRRTTVSHHHSPQLFHGMHALWLLVNIVMAGFCVLRQILGEHVVVPRSI
jgi:hypothetical protein